MIARSPSLQLIDRRCLNAWRPPQLLEPAEWATENVVLPSGSPLPGPLDHHNAPYLRGFLNLAARPGVAQLNVMKAGQLGLSAACRWLLGYWAVMDPSPIGLTLPDRIKGRKILSLDVLPFFRSTRVLRELQTTRKADENAEQVKLSNGFTLHLMWSGSSSSTASFPMKRVVNDEVDKMRAWGRGGGEGHAVHRTATRLRAFGEEALQVNVSTPTDELGIISLLFAASDVKLYFLAPCPKCKAMVRLVWGQVKWKHFRTKLPQTEWASRIMRDGAGWYECQACGKKITEQQRKAAMQQGRWGTCDAEGIGDGEIDDAELVEHWPEGTTIGMHVSALSCLWTSVPRLARDYILALGNLERIYSFVTETLGEAFEQQVDRVTRHRFSEMAEEAELEEGIVPWWAASLIATIDTQKDHFWLVIRAWGPGMRSARVFHGRVDSFDDLDRLCFNHPWPTEGRRFPPMSCDLVLIDSGGTGSSGEGISRTMQVYAWVLDRLSRVRAIKGDSKPRPGQFYRRGRGWYEPGGSGAAEKVEVPLWLLDVHHYQNELADLMQRTVVAGEDEQGKITTEPAWRLNRRDDPVYNEHMANLRKVAVREGGELAERWRPVTGGARVDLRDCEGYQVAAAYMRQVHLLPSLQDFAAAMAAEQQRATKQQASSGGIRMPDGRDFIASR